MFGGRNYFLAYLYVIIALVLLIILFGFHYIDRKFGQLYVFPIIIICYISNIYNSNQIYFVITDRTMFIPIYEKEVKMRKVNDKKS